jgi:putative DNA primase/helicase
MNGDDDGPPKTWARSITVTVTFFRNFAASTKKQETLALDNLAGRIRSQSAAAKSLLPWLKLAEFGDNRSLITINADGKRTGGSLRHDANIIAITGVELDYDGEQMSFEEACTIAEKAGLLCIIYTSPSHTEDAPRWRVLCPFSAPMSVDRREAMVGRVNGLYGAGKLFAAESWTRSQAYYYGAVKRNPSHQCVVIDGTPLDLKRELDITWANKPGYVPEPNHGKGTPGFVPHPPGTGPGPRLHLDEAALLEEMITGVSFHTPSTRLVGLWARKGVALLEARQRLLEAFDRCDDEVRTSQRWFSRRADIDRTLDFVYGKEAAKRDAKAGASMAGGVDPDTVSGAPGAEPGKSESGSHLQAAWDALRASLAKSDKDVVFGTHANLRLVLQGDPLLQVLVRRDEFAGTISLQRAMPSIIKGEPPRPGPYPCLLTDEDVTRLLGYLQKWWARAFTRVTLIESLAVQAQENSYHPVCDWLASLTWDGVPRLQVWLHEVFDCTKDTYHAEVGTKLLVAACRRARHPGCKFDYLVILEGDQGIGKSTALSVLFTPAWFMDDLHHDLANKDAPIGFAGKWCVELGEIGHLLASRSETFKAFLSRTTDHYRAPYGTQAVDVPRQSVMIGTTNDDDYLSDATGNRRIWPIRCLLGKRYELKFADIGWLEANRGQLWAEAAHREATGEPIWLVDEKLVATATGEQAKRLRGDVWRDRVLDYCEVHGPTVQIPLILGDALSIPLALQDKRAEMRVASVLREAGWIRCARWDGRKAVRCWSRDQATADAIMSS